MKSSPLWHFPAGLITRLCLLECPVMSVFRTQSRKMLAFQGGPLDLALVMVSWRSHGPCSVLSPSQQANAALVGGPQCWARCCVVPVPPAAALCWDLWHFGVLPLLTWHQRVAGLPFTQLPDTAELLPWGQHGHTSSRVPCGGSSLASADSEGLEQAQNLHCLLKTSVEKGRTREPCQGHHLDMRAMSGPCQQGSRTASHHI